MWSLLVPFACASVIDVHGKQALPLTALPIRLRTGFDLIAEREVRDEALAGRRRRRVSYCSLRRGVGAALMLRGRRLAAAIGRGDLITLARRRYEPRCPSLEAGTRGNKEQRVQI